MKNVTLAIDDELLERSREYAQKQGTTLNALIRQLLQQRVHPTGPGSAFAEFLKLAEKHPIRTNGPWKREDLYDL